MAQITRLGVVEFAEHALVAGVLEGGEESLGS